MTKLWGIHNDQPSLDLIGGGFVSVGWDEIGDLRLIGSRDELKDRIETAYPQAKAGAIPVWAGVLLRFQTDVQPGDIVISPNKRDRTLNFGRVEGEYYFDGAAETHRHRRKVTWLHTDVPREQFSKTARYEIGSAVTLFGVRNHAAEFEAFLSGATPAIDPTDPGPALSPVEPAPEDEPNADRIETYSRDFVIDTLMSSLTGHRFEHFVAELLTAAGYRTRVTQASGDGGVDVIAHRDPLGLEPPIIKVQCKRTLSPIGAPDVQKLMGTLSPGGAELGLFVTLGPYSKDAQHLGRTRHDLRLLDGNEVVSLVFEHYEDLAAEWKRLLPLRRVYVVDRDPEDG